MIKIYQCYTKNKFPFNIFAVLIRVFQKTDYSHYALSYVSETGLTIFFDSTPFGVRRMSEMRFTKHNEIIKVFNVSQTIERKSFLIFVQYYEGLTYGFGQIVGLLLKIFNVIKKNPFGKGAKYIICNELIILFLNWFNFTSIKHTDSLDLNNTENILREVFLIKEV